jgi:FkbM family methyltransferase
MKIEKRKDGFWWPSCDEVTYNWTHVEEGLPEAICKHLTQTRNVIHAGGNVGIYTKIYSRIFQNVYVFEPEHENFVCLTLNCQDENVFVFRGSLGDKNHFTSIDKVQKNNCGSYVTNNSIGNIPMFTIDSLNIENLDLIHLDVEGYESFVLEGGTSTIQQQRPIVAVEWLNNCQKFDRSQNEIHDFFIKYLEYQEYIDISNERVFIP